MVAKPGKLEVSWRGKKKVGGGRKGVWGWEGAGEERDDVSNPPTSFPENAV